MLDFVRRVERSRKVSRHESEFTTTLTKLFADALTYIEQKLPSQQHTRTERLDWVGPSFAMTDTREVHLSDNKVILIRLGREKGWTYRFNHSKPHVMIECWHASEKPHVIVRTEQYILSQDGELKLAIPYVPESDWGDIPDEDFAKRVQLVQETVAAFTGRSR